MCCRQGGLHAAQAETMIFHPLYYLQGGRRDGRLPKRNFGHNSKHNYPVILMFKVK